MPRLRIGLRARLFLVTIALAAIPLVGVGYVREMEILLREQQEQNLLAAARAVATALNDRPAMRRQRAVEPQAPPAGAPPTGTTFEPADTSVGAAGASSPPAETPGGGPTATLEAPAPPPAATPHPVKPSAVPTLIATEETAAPGPVGEQVEAIVTSLNRARSRVWVVDRKHRLLALAGSLRAGSAPGSAPDTNPSAWTRLEEFALRPLYAMILKRPNEDFDDSLPETAISSGPEVERALAGIAGARWRATTDNRAVIVSAAHPVFVGDDVVAAVVVEETTNAIQSFTARAFEKLISATLAVFVIVAAIMLLFAQRLATRVRRLRDEAESAIDARGRVRALTTASTASDEIGDLSRSFSQLLERLARYHDYLENLGARITHEFRTPVTVVRSSLDNLAMQPLPDEARQYMQRAEEGLQRLNKLITRMGEARRLEQALQDDDRAVYDVREVVTGCVAGYAAAYPLARFQTRIMESAARIEGTPDLLAQALDKLVANAVSFAIAGTPIVVRVENDGDSVVVEVENSGPALPTTNGEGERARLFDSMVSLRDTAAGDEPHLGLGLYVVRLVAEFHRGVATARNRLDGSGVVIGMRVPAA